MKQYGILLIIVSFLLTGCTTTDTVKGNGVTYSEYFKSLDKLDEKFNEEYRKPVPIHEWMKMAPQSLQNSIHLPEATKLPFKPVEQLATHVTMKDEDGIMKEQVQFSYHGDSNQFFIITVTEVDENPLAQFNFPADGVDPVGNEFRKEPLIEDFLIYHQIITTNSALTYKYYRFDEKINQINIVVTRANELYSYYNGHVYHIGYSSINNTSEQFYQEMLQLARYIIVGDIH